MTRPLTALFLSVLMLAGCGRHEAPKSAQKIGYHYSVTDKDIGIGNDKGEEADSRPSVYPHSSVWIVNTTEATCTDGEGVHWRPKILRTVSHGGTASTLIICYASDSPYWDIISIIPTPNPKRCPAKDRIHNTSSDPITYPEWNGCFTKK